MKANGHERAVVGVLLSRPSLEDRVLGALDVDDFHDPWPRVAFEICGEAHSAGVDITRGLVMAEMVRRGVANRAAVEHFLDSCTESGMLTLAKPEEHIRELRDRAFSERIKKRLAGLEDAVEIEAAALEEIGRRMSEHGSGPVPLGRVLQDVAARQHEIATGAAPVGYSTGLDSVDEHCLIRAGDLHTIVACTAAGKSWALLNLIRSNALNPTRPVRALLFSLEMDRDALAKRYFAREGGINSRLIDTRFLGAVGRESLDAIAQESKDVQVEIDDQSDLTVDAIVARTKHWKRRNQVRDGIVGVDFAQLVNRERGKDENNADALQRVAYSLRRLAQSERLAVVATAQLNREGEKDNAPRLDHIEGGGGPARASSLVLGLQVPNRSDTGSERAIEVHILKNRHGQAGQVLRGTVDFSTGRFAL